MRVVFDIAALEQGGMERQLIEVAAGLLRRGHDPLIAVNKWACAYGDELARHGLELVTLGRSRPYDLRVINDIVALSARHRADVIVGVNFNATLWSRIAARRAGIAAVVAEHSTSRGRPSKVVVSNRLLASQTDAIVACAEAQIESLLDEGNPRALISVVHNGVDVERFGLRPDAGAALRASLEIPHGSVVVGLVAAHRQEKRHDRFIALVEALVARGLSVYGLAVGGGPMLELTRRRAETSPAASSFRIVGPRADMVAAYSACEVCVMCSDAVETLPLALMEAQACEIPVVAMEIGGVTEAFRPGVSGLLVAQGDVGGMVSAVARLATRPADRRRMGRAGREWIVENRSIDQMVDGYEGVLNAAVEHHARRVSRR